MKFNLKVYCEKTRLKEIRDFVSDKLQSYTTDEVEINQLVLAVDEVCANLIIHSNACNAQESINLEVLVNGVGIYRADTQDYNKEPLKYLSTSVDYKINFLKHLNLPFGMDG